MICEHEKDGPFPSPGDCASFRECNVYNGEVETNKVYCDARNCCGNHFSEEKMFCVHPDLALCAPELRDLTCSNETQLLSHPTNCSRYFECSDMRPSVEECPDDLHFSSVLNKCVEPEEAQCDPMYCSKFDNPRRPKLLADPANCAAFYKCHNGQPVPMHCPTNLYFSVERDRCEFRFDVECKNGVRPKRL